MDSDEKTRRRIAPQNYEMHWWSLFCNLSRLRKYFVALNHKYGHEAKCRTKRIVDLTLFMSSPPCLQKHPRIKLLHDSHRWMISWAESLPACGSRDANTLTMAQEKLVTPLIRIATKGNRGSGCHCAWLGAIVALEDQTTMTTDGLQITISDAG